MADVRVRHNRLTAAVAQADARCTDSLTGAVVTCRDAEAPAEAPANASNEQPAPLPTRITVGLNYPWINHDWDFGCSPWPAAIPHDWRTDEPHSGDSDRRKWRRVITQDFALFRRLGVKVLRVWIMPDGLSYPRLEPGHYTYDPVSGNLDIELVPLGPDFLGDFKFLITQARDDIKLIPTFISFAFCWRAEPSTRRAHLYSKGRAGLILRHPQDFLSCTLAPLAQAAQINPSAIYAWDLMNEPDWVTDAPMGETGGRLGHSFASIFSEEDRLTAQEFFRQNVAPALRDHGFGAQASEGEGYMQEGVNQARVPLDKMIRFLRAAAGVVNEAGFPASIGFASHGTIQEWADYSADGAAFKGDLHTWEREGKYIHQFHFYFESDLPARAATGFQTTFIGEFSPREYDDHRHRLDMGDGSRTYPDNLYWCFQWFEDNGYRLALPWPTKKPMGDIRSRVSAAVSANITPYNALRMDDQCYLCQFAHGSPGRASCAAQCTDPPTAQAGPDNPR